MSTAFGIAAVTALLRKLLERSLAAAADGGIGDAGVKVTAQPPDRLAIDPAKSRLNLFLYEVTPNTGWSNKDLASRGPDGQRVSNPTLALDLQYLLSAYGSADLESEILLGHGMQAFHETPGISRASIRSLFDPGAVDPDLPKPFRERTISLADQFESIRISPRFLRTEEMSKIWTSLNTNYRPSMAYQVTVVLIEAARRVRSAPPVLMRGSGDSGASVRTGTVTAFPTLLAARGPSGESAVPVTGRLVLYGHHITGDPLIVRLENPRLQRELTASGAALTIEPADLSDEELAEDPALALADTRITVDLTQAEPAAAWAAGGFQVAVEVTPSGETVARMSNSLGIGIAPAFATQGADRPVITSAGGMLTVELTTTPPIQARQTASLIVGDQELPGPAFITATPKPKFKGKLPATMLLPGTTHLARLRVDGVDSVYIIRHPKPRPPEFDPAQRITIP